MNTPQLAQLGILDLVAQSGLVAKIVLAILLMGSFFSWTIIFAKWRQMRSADRENNLFLDLFWNSKNIDEVYNRTEKYVTSPLASVFRSGVKELKKLAVTDSKDLDEAMIQNIERALARSSNTEISTLEKQVGLLATVASASPFIGLFGTVWGIMNSFQNIGSTGSASLAVVAPGISEALVTTAMGIAAAVPAVIAYNAFAGVIKRQAVDMDSFTQDFLNIIRRSSFPGRNKGQL